MEGVGGSGSGSAPSNTNTIDKFNDINYEKNIRTMTATNNNNNNNNDKNNNNHNDYIKHNEPRREDKLDPLLSQSEDSSTLLSSNILQQHNNNPTNNTNNNNNNTSDSSIISRRTNILNNSNIPPIATTNITNNARRTSLSALAVSSSSIYLIHDHCEIIKYHNNYHTMLLLQDIIPTTTSLDSTAPSFGTVVSLVSSVEHKSLQPDDSEGAARDNDGDEDSDVRNDKLLEYLDFPFNYQVMIQGKESFPLTALTELTTTIVTSKTLPTSTVDPSEDSAADATKTAGPSSRPTSPSSVQYALVLTQTVFPQTSSSEPRSLVLYFSQRGSMRKWQKKLMDVLLDLVTIACLKRTQILLCVHNFSALFYYSLLADITQTLGKISQLFERNYSSDSTDRDTRQKTVRRYLTHFLKNHYFLAIYLDIVQIIYALLLSANSAAEKAKDDKGLSDVMNEVIESVAALTLEHFFDHHSPYHHLLRLAQLTPSSKAAAKKGQKQKREEAERLWQLKTLIPNDQRKKVEEDYLSALQLFLQANATASGEEAKDKKVIISFSQNLITAGGTASEVSLASSSLDVFADNKLTTDQITPSSSTSSTVEGKKQRRIIRFHGLEILPSGDSDNVDRVTSAPVSVVGSQTNSPDRAQGAAQPATNISSQKEEEKASEEVKEEVKEVVPPPFPEIDVPSEDFNATGPITYSEKVKSPTRSPPKTPVNDTSALSSGRTTTPSTPHHSAAASRDDSELLSLPNIVENTEKKKAVNVEEVFEAEEKKEGKVEESFEVEAEQWTRLDWLKYLIIALSLTLLCFNLNSPAPPRHVITPPYPPNYSALVPSSSSSSCTPSSAMVYVSPDASALVQVGGLECEALQLCESTSSDVSEGHASSDVSEALVTFTSPASSGKSKRGGLGEGGQLQRTKLRFSHIVQRFVQSIQHFFLKVFRRQ
eukprot:gene10617-11559_t